jgi:hypothetical protein
MDENTRCWTKIRDFAARFFFEKRRFWTKIRDVGRKYAILRLISDLKIADFGRKYAISQPLLDMRPALRAGLSGGSSLGQRPATLFTLKVYFQAEDKATRARLFQLKKAPLDQ